VNATTLHVELAAPEQSLQRLEADEVILPGEAGIMAIRIDHTPLLSTLVPGVVVVRAQEEEHFFAVSGGFAEVRENTVTVLAQTIERPEDIDLARAEAARERAMERLTARTYVDIDVTRAELALARSLARLQATSRQLY
jgi:F-type H+-transporting ATPase subunit epsilon